MSYVKNLITLITKASERHSIHQDDNNDEGSSNLTHGMKQVMCGNPVKALKARQQTNTVIIKLSGNVYNPTSSLMSVLQTYYQKMHQ